LGKTPTTPIDYSNWEWGISCTNSFFGKEFTGIQLWEMEKATKSLLSTEDLNLPKAPVMHEHSPRCRTEEDGVLTIYITDMYDVLKTEDYATFKMIF